MVESLLGKRTHKQVVEDREQIELNEIGEAKSKNNGTEEKRQSPYEIRDGLRFVKPYKYEFKTFAKRRWIDKKLLDIFKVEFKAFSPTYYAEAITNGKVTVNGKKVSIEYKIKEGDKIIHETVREETPVIATLPKLIYEDEEFVAFNKPSSLPVHACGNFMFNTLLKVVEIEMGYPDLKTVHRLDRQTSGILFFAKQ